MCSKHESRLIKMPKWFEKILRYNPREKSFAKAPLAIYLHLECLLKKEQSYQSMNQ